MWLSRLLPRSRQDWQLIATVVGIAFAAWSGFISFKGLPPDPPYLLVRTVGVQLPVVLFGNSLPIKAYWEVRVGLEPPRQIPLDKLTYEAIVFSNTGEQAFDWDEMVLTTIRVKLTSDEGQILSASVLRRDDAADRLPYRLEVEPGNRAFVFSTPVLNPRERIVIELLHSGKENALAVEGRVKEQGRLTLNRIRSNRSFWKRPAVRGVAGQQNILMVVLLLLMMVWVHKTTGGSWLSSLSNALLPAIAGPWVVTVLAYLCLATFLESSNLSPTLLYVHGLASLILSGLYLRFGDSRFTLLFRFPIRLVDKSADGRS